MLDSNSLYVYDEDGNEKKMIILFTFDSDETGCQYVVFQDPDNWELPHAMGVAWNQINRHTHMYILCNSRLNVIHKRNS